MIKVAGDGIEECDRIKVVCDGIVEWDRWDVASNRIEK